ACSPCMRTGRTFTKCGRPTSATRTVSARHSLAPIPRWDCWISRTSTALPAKTSWEVIVITHEIIVAMADVFAIFPDHWSLVMMGGELILNGDGSFITGENLGERIY